MTARRPSRAKVRGICPDCRHEVGAARDFVRTDALRREEWRLGLHRNDQGARCTASRMIVPAETLWEVAS